MTTKNNGYYYIDHKDEAVRGMLVVENGKLMYPPPAPVTPPTTTTTTTATKAIEPPKEIDYKAQYLRGARNTGLGASAILGMGMISPDAAFSSMLTTFCLSNVIGVQVVMGVTHALHSPLMAVTNAISGTTALGGMHLFAHATTPTVALLGAAATTLSTVNIVGMYRSCSERLLLLFSFISRAR